MVPGHHFPGIWGCDMQHGHGCAGSSLTTAPAAEHTWLSGRQDKAVPDPPTACAAHLDAGAGRHADGVSRPRLLDQAALLPQGHHRQAPAVLRQVCSGSGSAAEEGRGSEARAAAGQRESSGSQRLQAGLHAPQPSPTPQAAACRHSQSRPCSGLPPASSIASSSLQKATSTAPLSSSDLMLCGSGGGQGAGLLAVWQGGNAIVRQGTDGTDGAGNKPSAFRTSIG